MLQQTLTILILTTLFACSDRQQQNNDTFDRDTIVKILADTTVKVDSLENKNAPITPTTFFIKDTTKYSIKFLNDFRKRHNQYKINTVSLLNDTIIINNDKKDLIIIPTDLPLNRKIVYEAQTSDMIYMLTVKRVNYSTIEYEYDQKEKEKSIAHKSGLASLDPLFYYGCEGTIELKNGAVYGMNKYIDDSSECHTYILIGVGNISQSEIHHNCKNTKDNIKSILLNRK